MAGEDSTARPLNPLNPNPQTLDSTARTTPPIPVPRKTLHISHAPRCRLATEPAAAGVCPMERSWCPVAQRSLTQDEMDVAGMGWLATRASCSRALARGLRADPRGGWRAVGRAGQCEKPGLCRAKIGRASCRERVYVLV